MTTRADGLRITGPYYWVDTEGKEHNTARYEILVNPPEDADHEQYMVDFDVAPLATVDNYIQPATNVLKASMESKGFTIANIIEWPIGWRDAILCSRKVVGFDW